MKWIKKIKGLFSEEEVEEEVGRASAPTQDKIAHRHIDTKVTYQYPKGQFKFPVIPDQNGDASETQHVERRSRSKKTTNEPVDLTRRTNQRPQQKDQVEPKNTSKKKPFRPTEIPSAVHGFKPPTVKKPETSNQVIEFELPSREPIKYIREPEELNVVQQEIAVSLEIEPILVDEVADKPQDTVEETVDISDLLQKLQIEEVPDIDEANHRVDEPEENEKLLNNDKADDFVDDTLYVTEETSLLGTEEVDAKIELTHEDVSQLTYNDLSESEKQVSPESEKLHEQAEDPETTHSNQSRKRSSVPFNVLMLKQDRKKYVEKQSTTMPSQSNAPVPVPQNNSHQSIKVEEDKGSKAEHIDNEKNNITYNFPLLSYLKQEYAGYEEDEQWVEEQKHLLDQALRNFKVRAKVVNVTQGPAVTRFEVYPEPGVKVNKITNLSDDIKLNLSAKEIRIEAPIPGKNTIGIEVPNKVAKPVFLNEIVNSPEFKNSTSPLTVALGLDISGKPIVTDLNKMPHGLIAGATGSGKSVCINTMLVSLMYKAAPHEVKLLLIDPKMVELAPYNHIPHLVSPVITDVKAATAALKWAVEEMERRYELFAHSGVRDISRYNELVDKHQEQSGRLPYLVIIIDELADLMMVAPGEVEEAICRIAQKARACGIHLILATQRPSVDVITGLIKANIPTRIAFSVSSQVDSRTIIDSSGAEKLLGKGDMLFLENGSSKPRRIQGNFVSDDEIDLVVSHVKQEIKPTYLFEQDELIKKSSIGSFDDDELFSEACEFVFEQGGASTSSVQRRFRIGYNRAARLIDMMEEQGIISEARGSKPREILISEEEMNNLQEN
ncbi:DNA translocase FtsK [Litchfieldia alkalitelluris]|uniref:DNA translocase FtsK n=1 Tax=Litchfieldia alkalitelluris TaxID=304268 RepID=UPI000997DC10|nr:DNA translocase FtsK [Litchfieldia alkalitelluris]